MNYFYDSVLLSVNLEDTIWSVWKKGGSPGSLDPPLAARQLSDLHLMIPNITAVSHEKIASITWKNSEYRISSISVGGNRNGNGVFQLLSFSTFLSHSSHYKIYKLYLHFNCSKFGVGETGLPTYILLLFEKKTTQKPSKVEAAKKPFYPVFMLHFFVYEQTLEEQRGWNW